MFPFVLFLLFLSQIVKGQRQKKKATIVISEENDGTFVMKALFNMTNPNHLYAQSIDLNGFLEESSTDQERRILNDPLYEMVMKEENIVGDLIDQANYIKLVASINLYTNTTELSEAEKKKRSKVLSVLQKLQRKLEKGFLHEKFMHPMLVVAMINGHHDIARVLLTKYDVTANDVNRRNKFFRESILSIACRANWQDIVKLLLKIDGININVQDSDGKTALYTPSLRGYVGVVNLLIEGDINVNKCNNEGISPLFIAAELNRPAIVKILLNVKGIEVNTQVNTVNTPERIQGFTPLLIACILNNTKVVKALLSAEGIDVNRAVLLGSAKGMTPLHSATVGENVKIVKMLLKIKEIKVNLQCDLAGTALHAACNAGSFRVVKALLKHKEIAVNQEVKKGHTPIGNTPLISSVTQGYIKIVKELLKVNGILVNKGFLYGSHGFVNALIVARDLQKREPFQMHHKQMIKLLLKNGAKENDDEL